MDLFTLLVIVLVCCVFGVLFPAARTVIQIVMGVSVLVWLGTVLHIIPPKIHIL